MTFRLSINTLYNAISGYIKIFDNVYVQAEICKDAVICLADDGWEGKSKNEYYEKFLIWTEELLSFYERLSYLGKTLITLHTLAEMLQVQYSNIPTTVGAGGEIYDIVYLEGDSGGFESQSSDVLAFWEKVQSTLASVKHTGQDLKYRKLYLPSIDTVIDAAKTAHEQMTEFITAYGEYADNVTAFEEESPPKLGYAVDNTFNYEDSNSIIGWNDITGFAINIAKEAGIPLTKSIFKIPKIVIDGEYARFSGFEQHRFSGRYRISNLENSAYKEASTVFRIDKSLNATDITLKSAGWIMIAVSAGLAWAEEYQRNPYLPESRKNINAANGVITDLSVSAAQVALTATGAKVGAGIGTVGGLPGAAVGGAIGAAVGFTIGLVANSNKKKQAEKKRQQRYDELFAN